MVRVRPTRTGPSTIQHEVQFTLAHQASGRRTHSRPLSDHRASARLSNETSPSRSMAPVSHVSRPTRSPRNSSERGMSDLSLDKGHALCGRVLSLSLSLSLRRPSVLALEADLRRPPRASARSQRHSPGTRMLGRF